jgi:hypothetical protein
VKKIRRTRIRTETSRLVFIQDQPAEVDETRAAHDICPTCGQPVMAAAKNPAQLSPLCAEVHDESNREGVFDLIKEEK